MTFLIIHFVKFGHHKKVARLSQWPTLQGHYHSKNSIQIYETGLRVIWNQSEIKDDWPILVEAN